MDRALVEGQQKALRFACAVAGILDRPLLLLALVITTIVATLSLHPLPGHAAAAAACPTGTVCDRALGIAIRPQPGWLRLLPPKVPPHVIALVTRPANNLCCADYTDRLHIAAWGTTHDRNAARAANAGANRLIKGFRAPLAVTRTPVRYGGAPGVLVRGLPPTPAPALDIVLAHAGAVYLIIAPGTRLAPDQQAALASLRFFPRQGAFPPTNPPAPHGARAHRTIEGGAFSLDALALTPLHSMASVPAAVIAGARSLVSPGATVRVEVRLHSIRPGERQTVVISGLPPAAYPIKATMPDGETLVGEARPFRGSGARWSFTQPPDTITRISRRATISLTVGARTYSPHYSIAFGPIDLVVPHTPVAENSDTVLWVHTEPRGRVTLQLTERGSTSSRSLRVGRHGWASMHVRVANDVYPFRPMTVGVVAAAHTSAGTVTARADFQVLPFQFDVSVGNVQILYEVAGSWVTTTSVHPGEEIRVQGTAIITEPAGNIALCVPGYVTLAQGAAAVQAAPIHCANATQGAIEAELQVSTQLKPGPAELDIDVSYENGSSHQSLPISITAG